MKIIAAIALLIMSMNLHAQDKPNYETSIDPKDSGKVFKGLISFQVLDAEPTFVWYKRGAALYKPDVAKVEELKATFRKYTMVVLMGTWCEDSQHLIPQLYKVLTEAKMPMENITMYGVDREKITGMGMEKKYDVTFVPTIILYDGKKELGRITENVNKSVEADLVEIVRKKGK